MTSEDAGLLHQIVVRFYKDVPKQLLEKFFTLNHPHIYLLLWLGEEDMSQLPGCYMRK